MDYSLNDEQAMLQETARRFVEHFCPPIVAKGWDDAATYPEEMFQEMARLGWISLAYPESQGGGGGGPIELTIIAEELGRASFDVAMCYIASLIAGLSFGKYATPEQRERILPGVFAGTQRFAVSISEPDAGSDVKAIATRAEIYGDTLVVNGQKLWCTGAGLPGTILAMYVRTSGNSGDRSGISLVLVDPNVDGVELRKVPTLARHILGTYEVYLHNVELSMSSVVGTLDQGWDILLSGLELERVLLSGGYVGAAQATVDDALLYAKNRRQFGSRIGDFQAIAHMIADLQTDIDAARLMAYRAAWMLGAGQRCVREGSMGKLFASETYVRAARQGMQICAGSGFSTDSVMSYRYRESIVATISGGTSQIQRNTIANQLGLRP